VNRRARLAAALGAVLVLVVVGALPAGADDDVVIDVTIPEAEALRVTDAQLRWGVNAETGGGAFYGGCNFLSAGVAGSTGGSRPWTAADGFYAARAGAVRIEKDAKGGKTLASWATRCLDASGKPVSAGAVESTSGNEVVVDGGTGTVDVEAGAVSVRWKGSFTAVFYGGMTYWSASDPVLEVADGAGRLTATLSGWGADREDPTRWVALAPRTVTLAELQDVRVTRDGLVVTPQYVGRSVNAPSGWTPQVARDATNAPFWGAFPQDFVDYQALVGQASYWYTSGGARDRAKPPTPVVVSFDASAPVTARGDDDRPGSGGGAAQPEPTASAAVPRNVVRNRPATAARPPAAAVRGADASADGTTTGALQVPAGAGVQSLAATPAAPPDEGTSLLDDLRHDPLAVGALGAVLLLASAGALGLRQGWVVLPWAR